MLEPLSDAIQLIDHDIYISGQLFPEQLSAVMDTQIRSVLNLRCDDEIGFRAHEQEEVEKCGRAYAHMPVSAERLHHEWISKILNQLDTLPKPVLISCRSAFRSGFIALLYLVTRHQLSDRETQKLKHKLGLDFSKKALFKQCFEGYLTT